MSSSQDEIRLPRAGLHEVLDQETIMQLKRHFKQKNMWLYKSDFRLALAEICNIHYEDDEFEVLYMKVDSER